ncbi:MAG: alpha/beta hydrolase fold domain-containing protein [Melioribacteraceae bacterium]|nr:alpha/beta hydrolase fold domain-containing protein [Melioribacteraceae bacterium]MCF8354250.1 alpha/beta hydrolase fold domain-containing protein [Melioribacteraceae bacterium]MCF8394814.1 alpha/beta hydrolase fold domain-containing protein [Melioribacteraceae bacterium]MCF8417981.1 alpha/beta hydrolase fold domain-containing protein [Melioribacteraceae bacterium]
MIRLVIIIIFTSQMFAQRYLDSTFIPVQTHTNQAYATAPKLNAPWTDENNTTEVDLTMHIFQPEGDTEDSRPAVLMFHSGAFVSGSKENEDMIKFCKNLTGKGYVTASVQYRLGMNSVSQVSGERAVYRGIQDGRAAVRYIKSNAAALKIDTANIFMLGSSAGSFIALHNLFMNEESERPAGTFATNYDIYPFSAIPDLGTLDAIEPSLNSGKGSHPKAIAVMWGALQNTTLILPEDLNYPVLLIHGKADGTVPFGVGAPFGWSGFPDTYGSSPISMHFDDLGFAYNSYFVDDEDHEFYGCYNGNWDDAHPINSYWNIILTKVTNFFYNNLDESLLPVELTNFTANISERNVELEWKTATEVNNYGFEVERQYQVSSPPRLAGGETGIEYQDSSNWETIGFVQGHGTTNSPKNYEFTDSELPNVESVDYRLKQIDLDGNFEYSDIVTVGTKNLLSQPTEFVLHQNYPNPFNPTTTIKYKIPALTRPSDTLSPRERDGVRVSISIYNTLGQQVAALVNEQKEPGNYETEFDASKLASGIYFYRLQAGNFTSVKKLMLMK